MTKIQIKRGDLLISANGVSFTDRNYDEVLTELQNLNERPIRVKFRRYKRREYMQSPSMFKSVVSMMNKLRMCKETAAVKIQTAYRGYREWRRIEAER